MNDATAPEFSRPVKVRPHPPEEMAVTADAGERSALAKRFGVAAIDSLEATARFAPDGAAVDVIGTITADLVQTCAVAGDNFPVRIEEPFTVRFVPPTASAAQPDEEVELDEDDLDEIEFNGETIDLGEAVAQSLSLAIDPYAEGPNADAARAEAGIEADDEPRDGPLADLLKGLKRD
ncbi:YceD family protein [Tsuneonella mangrovi]|uniref:YceD family protein n=1 Tax=Tsuneonella mangrovi TaxID=1982042 RepID=UPI000BA22F2A|nr:YceD family protein [Tsuneonella mangrovi]